MQNVYLTVSQVLGGNPAVSKTMEEAILGGQNADRFIVATFEAPPNLEVLYFTFSDHKYGGHGHGHVRIFDTRALARDFCKGSLERAGVIAFLRAFVNPLYDA